MYARDHHPPHFPAGKAPLEHRRLRSLRVLGAQRMSLQFRDGFIAELDLQSHLQSRPSPMSDDPLLSENFFAQVFLDDGVLTWPNGFDIDPTTLRTWAERGIA